MIETVTETLTFCGWYVQSVPKFVPAFTIQRAMSYSIAK